MINTIDIEITTSEEYLEYVKLAVGILLDSYKDSEINEKLLLDIASTHNPLKATRHNWFDVKNKLGLNSLTVADLRFILSVNCLPVSGKKQTLIDRIWDIHHKNSLKSKSLYKSKSGLNAVNIYVDDSDDEYDSLTEVLKNASDIFIKNKRVIKGKLRRFKRKYIADKNWVFKEYEDYYEFLGSIENSKLVLKEIPLEIMREVC
tara:strand:+ start:217 stop:828 length:612 start_codon:yes stop_codon:yes gene_type:complete